MKYYVYANKTNVKDPSITSRALFFVPQEDLRIWASKYDAIHMEYCGVSVEAADATEAKNIFLTPVIDKILVEQEPLVTRYLSQKVDDLSAATTNLMAERLATLWMQIDQVFHAIAKLHVLQNQNITEEQAYATLKKKWLDRYRERE